MPCSLCLGKDHGAEEGNEYICGSCVAHLSTLNSEGARHLIDQLYLKDRVDVAEWIEKIMTGSRSTGKKLELKRRVIPIVIPKLKRRGLVM